MTAVNNNLDLSQLDLSVAGLRRHYFQKQFAPRELMAVLLEANRRYNSTNPIWITLLTEAQLEPWLARLDSVEPESLPLYGIPFAIKDNIDLAGIPTSAACKAFTYTPDANATVVQRLLDAGAIPIGKTNLDQFATGLVGTRSPWGACHNALNPDYISGGSSSGSAVAVAKGLCSFSLGTDTAGSGRVPAALNNIVGLKPTHGLLSTNGVVPACRSLDCVSIFAQTVADANTVLDVSAAVDTSDPFSRATPFENGPRYFRPETAATIGVPAANQLQFFGDEASSSAFNACIETFKQMGTEVVEIDFHPFVEAARLLYEGPWVAERYLATQPLIDTDPEALLAVTRTIISKGRDGSAADAFKARYRLQALQQQARQTLATIDALLIPTIGRAHKLAAIETDPIGLNSELGYYTNFMNLLDCAGVAMPVALHPDGIGIGVTLVQQAHSDKRLLSLAAAFQAQREPQPAGALNVIAEQTEISTRTPEIHIDVAVCGAHLDGLALNWQLRERGGRLLEETSSAPAYRFYALAGGPVRRPAMMRVATPDQVAAAPNRVKGASIDMEVWRVPQEQFGSFVAEIPAPLGIGKVELKDGRWVTGFICEASGIEGAEDITAHGSWRAFLASLEH